MSNVTSMDIRTAGNNGEAAKRVAAALEARRKTNPNYSLADLAREVGKVADRPKNDAGALSDDIRLAATNAQAAKRVMAALAERRKTNADFTLADLSREVRGVAGVPSTSAPQSISTPNEAEARAIMGALIDASMQPDLSVEAQLRALVGTDVAGNRDLDRFMGWIRSRATDAYAIPNAQIYINRIGHRIGETQKAA